MVDFICNCGVPDAVAKGQADLMKLEKPKEPKESFRLALTGGSSPPSLNISKSHLEDPRVTSQFDIDVYIVEAMSFEALKGLWFLYHPRPN